ncbi:hypothetical protein XH81_03390 [Bradyrhizobium sp. CCBAU 25360]|uniref:hypothetical protein n=1 Tax=Bradyrhizobium sp. CCBAU 25360 TaxID=858425 RepID=UPI0023057F14|nr:hypothetical protein [Bradyrhizobium sp. CCBAU 25360]MDA9413927.1 hypothetical protein [Bradyrhizobium sp. CCBAU 25360]
MEANYFDALDHAAQRLAERRNFHPENHSGDFIKFLRDAYGIRKAQAPEDLDKGMIWRLDNNAKTLFSIRRCPRRNRLFWIAHVIGLLERRESIGAADQTGTIKQ